MPTDCDRSRCDRNESRERSAARVLWLRPIMDLMSSVLLFLRSRLGGRLVVVTEFVQAEADGGALASALLAPLALGNRDIGCCAADEAGISSLPLRHVNDQCWLARPRVLALLSERVPVLLSCLTPAVPRGNRGGSLP